MPLEKAPIPCSAHPLLNHLLVSSFFLTLIHLFLPGKDNHRPPVSAQRPRQCSIPQIAWLAASLPPQWRFLVALLVPAGGRGHPDDQGYDDGRHPHAQLLGSTLPYLTYITDATPPPSYAYTTPARPCRRHSAPSYSRNCRCPIFPTALEIPTALLEYDEPAVVMFVCWNILFLPNEKRRNPGLVRTADLATKGIPCSQWSPNVLGLYSFTSFVALQRSNVGLQLGPPIAPVLQMSDLNPAPFFPSS
ncbi:hypothetical protein HRG_014810 [Hirsutella rhossiliensis]